MTWKARIWLGFGAGGGTTFLRTEEGAGRAGAAAVEPGGASGAVDPLGAAESDAFGAGAADVAGFVALVVCERAGDAASTDKPSNAAPANRTERVREIIGRPPRPR